MTCWPPCGPWCFCDDQTGESYCRETWPRINAVRFQTLMGRWVHAALGGSGLPRLRTADAIPQQWETFLFTSPRPPYTVPYPMDSGQVLALEVCDENWSPSGLNIRVTDGIESCGEHLCKLVYKGSLYVQKCCASRIKHEEHLFIIEKAGGGQIVSGDHVAIKTLHGYYFRDRPTFPTVDADSQSPFEVDTTFIVEFSEVRPGLGWRPTKHLRCRDCADVRGRVTDTTGQPVRGASVDARGVLENHPFSSHTTDDGSFYLMDPTDPEGERSCIPAGSITVEAWHRRYQRGSLPVTVPVEGTIDVDLVLRPTEVVGQVVDDRGVPVPGTSVSVTDAQGTQHTPTTAADGTFVASRVAHGPATAWAPGMADPVSFTVPPEGTHLPLTAPRVTSIQLKLTWGGTPRDLDTHMTGPDNTGGRFHLFFKDKKPLPFTDLDIDARAEGGGTETVTLRRTAEEVFVAGDYRYWIHNFSRTSFAGSDATVELLVNHRSVHRYVVAQATGNVKDDLWRVVDLSIDANGTLQRLDHQALHPGDEHTLY